MDHPTSRILVGLAIAASAVLLYAAPTIVGAATFYDSTVTLGRTNPFHGHVSSPKRRCEVHRLISVYQVKKGPDYQYGKTRTDRYGNWSIPATPKPNGDFRAYLRDHAEGIGDGTTMVCEGNESPIRHFGD